ncbi:MAG TPA: VOC family protein [Acidimicrobiia bacterium]|nr:VOC family protein [Acidimicrobiia bacterium]
MPHRDLAPVGAPVWVDLMTSDPDASRAFYGELFGWTSESAPEEFGGYVNFAKEDVPVAGCMKNSGEAPYDLWSVYLASADAQATFDAATKRGGAVELAPMPVGDLGVMAFVLDPGQGRVGIWQPGEHKGFGTYDEPGTPGWFELHTRTYDATVAFYRDVFHWDAHTMSDTPEFRYTTYGENEGALAGIMDATNFGPPAETPGWSVYFRVENADSALARTVELGGKVVLPAEDTPYGRLAVASDVTGAGFKLVGRS